MTRDVQTHSRCTASMRSLSSSLRFAPSSSTSNSCRAPIDFSQELQLAFSPSLCRSRQRHELLLSVAGTFCTRDAEPSSAKLLVLRCHPCFVLAPSFYSLVFFFFQMLISSAGAEKTTTSSNQAGGSGQSDRFALNIHGRIKNR